MDRILKMPEWAFMLLIAALALVIFLPYIGNVHLFDWDEINFAESAREMILTGDYTRVKINFLPFWEKPPLFIWLQAASMNIFGINEFAARFPNILTGVATLLVLAWIGRREYDRKFSIIWVIVYAGSLLTHFYFRTAIIDPLFNLFIFLGIYQAYLSFSKEKSPKKYSIHSLWAGLFIGLAIITKGPVALLIFLITSLIILLWYRKTIRLHFYDILLFGLSCLVISTIWFGYETYKNGIWFIQRFISYQITLFTTEDSGHGGPFYYHWLVLLIGCFPASIFFMGALKKQTGLTDRQRLWIKWNIILFFSHLILFSIVKTKIIHYSSLCYFPLSFLATVQLYRIYKGEVKLAVWQKWIFAIVGILLSIVFMAMVFIGRNTQLIIPYVKDKFAVANLGADVDWPIMLYLIGFLFLVMIISYLLINKLLSLSRLLIPFIAIIILMQFILICYVPRIEQYSQASMIEFYQSLQKQDVYVSSLGFKSYGQYFYTDRQASYNTTINDTRIIQPEPLDKPAYIVLKIHQVKDYPMLTNYTNLGSKNGYAFYKREMGK
ncbi:MAG TPA: glycosyltransferase family 39 protein [Saprospiraceae bacterium]|nr:glycosyltransferase family 39 protein [Saprospiraceae bacterium]